MMGLKLVSAVLLSGAVFTGCGSSSASPVEFCNDVAETQCHLVYQCYTAAQIAAAQYPATEAACITQLENTLGCSAQTSSTICDASNAVYHGEAVDGCVSQAENLSCAEFMQVGQNGVTLESLAPKCAEVCVIPG